MYTDLQKHKNNILYFNGDWSFSYCFRIYKRCAQSLAKFNVEQLFFLAISAFAIFFIALQYVSEAAWATPFKRVAEGITSYFIVGGIIMLLTIVAGKLALESYLALDGRWHHGPQRFALRRHHCRQRGLPKFSFLLFESSTLYFWMVVRFKATHCSF